MNKRQTTVFTGLIVLLLLSGCGINSSVMFKTPKGTDYTYDSIPERKIDEYQVGKDDKFRMFVSSNYAHNLINHMSGISDANGMQTQVEFPEIEYLIDVHGEVNLPIIGRVNVTGLTVKRLEDTISYLYTHIGGYNNPYTKIQLSNQRVVVFPGSGGDAVVVPLVNNNTTLMEALAAAGGIAQRGKANTVKLMRMVDNERKVYLLDMSTIAGIKYSDILVQANDYIYVEPHDRYGREVLAQISPFVTIMSTVVLILFTALSK